MEKAKMSRSNNHLKKVTAPLSCFSRKYMSPSSQHFSQPSKGSKVASSGLRHPAPTIFLLKGQLLLINAGLLERRTLNRERSVPPSPPSFCFPRPPKSQSCGQRRGGNEEVAKTTHFKLWSWSHKPDVTLFEIPCLLLPSAFVVKAKLRRGLL